MKIGFIGFGKMGSAIAEGLVKNGLYTPENVCVYDVFNGALDLAKSLGYATLSSIQEVFNVSQTVLFAIKPQEVKNTLTQIKNLGNCSLIISIMAGVPIKTLESLGDIAIARVMPNTCALILESASSVCYNSFVTNSEKELTRKILLAIGDYVEINESLMDEVIPLAGSFTAYAYTFMNAFIKSAVKRGISEEVAKKLVIKSMIGSANMVKEYGDIETLTKNVCSKGGTTLAGLEQLEKANFDKIIDDCSIACANRSKELGKIN